MGQGLLRSELRRLVRLAIPVALAQLAVMGMGFVDLLMVGRLSVEAFAALGLANPWIFGTMLFANGIILGIDPLVTQAHGAGDAGRTALALQRGVVAALLLSAPVMLLFGLTEDVLLLLGQDPALAHQAQLYARVQIPSVPFFLSSVALRQYLQGRELVRPTLYVVLVANVLNALFNGVLIFGWGGFPPLGLEGAGIATALTRALSFAMLLGWVRLFRLHDGAWLPWSRAAIAPHGLLALARVGLPIAVQMSLEMWAFSGSNYIAGRLGALDLAAHQVVMNLASITFMVPLGISQAVVIRVGNLLGAGRAAEAQRAAGVGMGLGAAVMSLAALGFVLGRHALPHVYTPDPGVIAAAAAILPIAAAFQIFDGTQVVACGVLRGMGRPLPAAAFNFVGYWVLALPIGGWLALSTDAGLAGLWSGLCLGLVVVALCLVGWIARRGPGYRAPAPA